MSSYQDVVGPHLGPGFVYSELVKRGSPRHALPPEKWWPRMVRPLQLANLLRERMRARGARGLRIQAAFRPSGGAALSQHKFNRALDLDLLPGDQTPDLRRAFAEEATKLYCELGSTEEIGIGLYGRPKSEATLRVHVDCGARTRQWHYYGQLKLTGPKTDLRRIAERLGLDVP
jgi:hypothetical protein